MSPDALHRQAPRNRGTDPGDSAHDEGRRPGEAHVARAGSFFRGSEQVLLRSRGRSTGAVHRQAAGRATLLGQLAPDLTGSDPVLAGDGAAE